MTRTREKFGLLATVVMLSATFSLSSAAYEPMIILKFPFISEHTDSLGNIIQDSLVRYRAFQATLYRTGMTDSLKLESATNDSGFSVLQFEWWPSDSSPVDSTNIRRLDILLPNTYRAVQDGNGYTFEPEPLRIESVPCSGSSEETISVVLPLSVCVREFTIGNGPFHYDFVVLTDCHIADGKKEQNGMEDFGTQGWDDEDNDPTETTPEIENNKMCRDYINTNLIDPHLRFVAITGDITSSSERSEWQRARKVFAGLDSRVFIVPLMGNHDGWPYVGRKGDSDEQPSNEVVIGEYFTNAFKGVYDTLRSFLPAANWGQHSYLLVPTSFTNHTWPSYYNNFAFNYQGCKFIVTDFNTRCHALLGWPGLMPDPDTYWGERYHWTMDWLEDQVASVPDGERIICLGHHAYMRYRKLGVEINFTPHELHQISDRGLLNNRPIATSIGGHLHPFTANGRLPYDNDTICDYYVLGAAKDGYLSVFHIYDAVQLRVEHYPQGTSYRFNALYSCQGSENAPREYRWDFGDGSPPKYGFTVSHQFRIVTDDTLYKVSLRVKTNSGRHVWATDTVRVMGPWVEMAPMPPGLWGKPVKRGGWLAYNQGNGLIFGAKGYKTGDFYCYDLDDDVWTELCTIPRGPEGRLPRKGCKGVTDGNNYVYMTKGNNTLEFWRYDIAGNTWSRMRSVPEGPSRKKVKGGTDLAYVVKDDTGWVYLLKGYKTEFYKYDVANNAWTTLPDVPYGTRKKYDKGSFLVYDGDNTLYAHQAKYYDKAAAPLHHHMFKYDVAGNSWYSQELNGMPLYGLHSGRIKKKKSKDGGSGAWHNGEIYALKGGNTQQFWKYTPSSDSWTELDTVPNYGSTGRKKRVKYGADIVCINGTFYALKGNKTLEFWRYVLPPSDWYFGLAGAGYYGQGKVDGPGAGEEAVAEGYDAYCPRWNSSGTWVTYFREENGYNQIFMSQYGIGNSEVRLTDIETDCEVPVFGPNNTWIAFQMMDTITDCYQICKVATGLGGGSGEYGPGQHTVAAGKPLLQRNDKSQIAAEEPFLQKNGDFQMTNDKSQIAAGKPLPQDKPQTDGDIVQLTFDEYDHTNPEWSLNGETIVFQKDDATNWTQLYLVPADSGEETQLTSDDADHEFPAYLSDHEIVYQLSPPWDDDQIAKLDLETMQQTELTSEPTDHAMPCPSYDGNSVTYQVQNADGMAQIGLVSSEGGDEHYLTEEEYDLEEPDWSPDNMSIYCVRWVYPGSEIGLIDACAGGYTPMTDAEAIRDNPDTYWGPNLPFNLVVYEREGDDASGTFGYPPRRRRKGTGIFLTRARRARGGPMGDNLGVIALHRAMPNPAVNKVKICWQVPTQTRVSLKVYNIAGQRVKTLVNRQVKPGRYETVWDGTDAKGRKLAAGVYFYALDTGNKRLSRKVVLTGK